LAHSVELLNKYGKHHKKTTSDGILGEEIFRVRNCACFKHRIDSYQYFSTGYDVLLNQSLKI